MSARKFDGVNKLLAEYDFGMNEDIPGDIKCLKCKKILINACQVPCGCRFCRVCIDELLESGCRVCPGNTDECGESNLSDIQIDYRVQKNISKIVVKCPEEMCSFECELTNMNEHFRVCPNKRVKCIFYGLGCDQSNVTAANISEHLQLASYSHMEILIGVIDNMRNEIDQLKESDERNKNEIDGLKESDERNKNEIDRLKDSDMRNKDEIDRLKESVDSNKNEINRLKDSDMRKKDEIDRLKESNERNKNEIDRLKESNDSNKSEIDQLKKSDDRNKKESDRLKSDSVIKAERIESLEEEIKLMKEDNLEREIGETVAKMDAGLSEMRQEWRDSLNGNEAVLKETNERYQTDMETRMSATEKWIDKLIDGTFVWTIENVAQRRQNDEVIESEYFYGKTQPYKIALIMCANGYGFVDGTGLSIYLYIYSDVRDEWLKWSLPADVSIKIVNKANPNACKTITKRYTIEKSNDNSCYQLNDDGDFDFLYADLCDASLLIGDCFIIECRCDVRLNK